MAQRRSIKRRELERIEEQGREESDVGVDRDESEETESEREVEAPAWARDMVESHKKLIDSNNALSRTIRRLARQVRALTGAVARCVGYQVSGSSDHSSDRDAERRQKRRHDETPTAPETSAIPPVPETGIPNPFTFVDVDDLFFSPMALPDLYQQNFNFMDLLCEQQQLLEQVIGKLEVERYLPD